MKTMQFLSTVFKGDKQDQTKKGPVLQSDVSAEANKPKQSTASKQSKNEPIISLAESNLEYEDSEGIRRIQAFVRMRKQVKIYKKLRQTYRYRVRVIQELLQTELNYVRDLKITFDNLYSLFNEDQQSQLFCNFGEILQLNQLLSAELKNKIDTLNDQYQQVYKVQPIAGYPQAIVFDSLLQFLDKFNVYFPYCAQFTLCQSERKKLQNDQSYAQMVSNFESNPITRGLDSESYLVMPIQRLPRYELLLVDLLKHTPKDHLDYENIEKCKIGFKSINDQNNQLMDQQMKNMLDQQQMDALQKQYGSKQVQINKIGRRLLADHQMQLYNSPKDIRDIKIYICNDVVLIVEKDRGLFANHNNYKFSKMIPLNTQTQCLPIEDTKFYQNMFKICGQRIYTMVANSSQQRAEIIAFINDIVVQLKQDQLEKMKDSQAVIKPNIKVLVCGTEEHNVASISKYTVYIILIELARLRWKTYLRFSQLESLQEFIKSHYPKIQISPLLKSSWIKNHDVKYLEQRKISIENFIQSIFDTMETTDGPILQRLSMPVNFFKLHAVIKEEEELNENQQLSELEEANPNPNVLIASRFAKQVHFQKTIKDTCEISNVTIKIIIRLPDQTTFCVDVNEVTKAIEVCGEIAAKLKLEQYYDYRLHVTDSKGNSRTLDNNQVILQSLPRDPNIFEQNQALVKLKVFFIQSYDEVYILEFKKYLYLSKEMEEFEYKQDGQRLNLLVQEILHKLKKQEYPLTPNDYALFFALQQNLSFNNNTEKKKKKKELHVVLRRVIPREIINQYTTTQWKDTIANLLSQIKDKIREILVENRNLKQEDINGQYKQELFNNKADLTRMLIINAISKNPLYGVTKFYVAIEMSQSEIFRQLSIKVVPNYYLGVCYQGIYIMCPSRQTIYYRIAYKQLIKLSVEGNHLLIAFDDRCLQFVTEESYRIQQMVSEYQQYEKLF